MSVNYRIRKIAELLSWAQNLPDKIIDDIDFKLHFEDAKTGDPAYAKKRGQIFGDLSDLILALRGFIKVNFGADSEYFNAIHNIYFTSEGKGFIMNTFNINHNEYWYAGKTKLISLIRNIQAEIEAKIELEKDQGQPLSNLILRIVLFIILSIVIQFIIWTEPATLAYMFAKNKIFAVQITLSLSSISLLLTITSPKHWQIFLSIGVALLCVCLAFIK